MSHIDVETARILLQRLGVRPEDLVNSATTSTTTPTFGDYIPRLRTAVPTGTSRAYASYWTRIETLWHDRRLDEPTASEFKQLVETTKKNAIVRRNSRGGRSAAEHMVAAIRCLYRHAHDDGYLSLNDSPATTLTKPRRAPSPRSALTDQQLTQIIRIAETTGNDPELDALILRLHIETACRRAGALALRPKDIDPDHCLLWLREKDQSDRWQPISPTLANALLAHASRSTDPRGQLLRYRNGKPITGRRYDHLWTRIGRHLPWVRTQQITAHWLRHTTLTWVERNFGYAIARAYAGHSADAGNIGATMTYVRATLAETAMAVSSLTGEPHPLISRDHAFKEPTVPWRYTDT
ncbi:tyrosine-type recombinase/integrase [Nocardia kruczakiae]|uniref:tyrosine-type recombinase/integrase n=1 Tax=Nocardia kruczakiae TaxID=261477 RepID=UPI0007A3B873|nr:site-specific integrase [Nocardia kruczakiae]